MTDHCNMPHFWTMHPLVRDLYKRAIIVGRDYPHPDGLEYVRRTWKAALRDSKNCPSCYTQGRGTGDRGDGSAAAAAAAAAPKPNCLADPKCEKEIRLAVGRGRKMVNEMVHKLTEQERGHVEKKKPSDTMRVMFENVNSLGVFTTGKHRNRKLRQLRHLIKEYEVDIAFFKAVDAEGSTFKVLPRSVQMHVMKKEKDDEEFWPRLLKDKALEKNQVSSGWLDNMH